MAKIGNFFGATAEPVDMRCAKCGKGQSCKHPHVSPVGKGEKNILIVLDGVDESADRAKNFAEGQSYKFLLTELNKLGINIYRDCWVVPSIRCHTKNVPTKADALSCKWRLVEDIERLKPKFIWTFGNIPLGTVCDEFHSGLQDSACHGEIIPLDAYKAWISPFFATFMVQKNKKDSAFQARFKRDLEKSIQFVEDDPKFIPYTYADPKNVEFVTEYDEVIGLLEDLRAEGGEYTFDLEATGLKPHSEGHKITTVGIANDDQAWAFPLDYQTFWNDEEWNSIIDELAAFMEDPSVILIAHNKSFENMWCKVMLDVDFAAKKCTMIRQHILDNRQGTKSLKYQSFIRWGIHSYEKNANRWIKSSGGANTKNRMDDMPLPEQLLYVGLDSFLTMKLYREQEDSLKYGKLKQACSFFEESSDTMVSMQLTGSAVDVDYFKTLHKDLSDRIIGLEKAIKANEDVLEFAKQHRRPFDASGDDLKAFLFKQLKLESTKETTNGGQSTDAEVLKELDHPVCGYILELRKYGKLRDTYLAQFAREEVNGLIHPFFNLATVVSYRSSSSDPNDQNIPKRDKESKIAIRTGLIPRPGRQIAEIDFSGMEVSTSATYHKDPNFIHYLVTPGTDMHRDGACDIWMLEPEEISHMIRFFVKNGWTFPQFYGDWYQSCASALWNSSLDEKTTSGIVLREHLHDKHIHTLEEFTEHCKTAEDILWKERFKVYTQWKKDIYDFYLQNGYVETHLGFRFTGLMDRKQAANYPIQGTAFHLLLTTINLMMKRKKKYGWKSDIIGQVHDSCKLDLVPEETKDVLYEFQHIATVELPKMFPWINVPYSVDAELSEIDGSFAIMNEVEIPKTV